MREDLDLLKSFMTQEQLQKYEDSLNKREYYTPELSEFHIGFEYEEVGGGSYTNTFTQKTLTCFEDLIGTRVSGMANTWDAKRWFFDNYHNESGLTPVDVRHQLNPDRLRVKYLDADDIKSLGFEYNSEFYMNNDNGYQIWKTTDSIKHNYFVIEPSASEMVFKGEIKNKSVLKQILKQLNIEYAK